MTSPPRIFLFWDIDGTLLSTARAGVFALEQAATDVCGATPDFQSLHTAGLTDAEVAALAIRSLDRAATPEIVDRFLRAYERHLPTRLFWRQGQRLRGVVEVLEALHRREDVASLLLTGNTPAGALAKLSHYGLARYFARPDGSLRGAFCIDGCGRAMIARRARDVARHLAGAPPDGDRVYVIGDTPADVTCGKAIGARTVAVASGAHSIEELQACRPWLALRRLPPPDRFGEALGLPAMVA